jgi:hypothetical protein
VSTELYRILEAEPSLSAQALTAIRDLRLCRPDRVRAMFNSPSHHTRWAAIQSLNAGAQLYRQADIVLLNELLALLPHVLLPRPLEARKKMLGRETHEWECVCGGRVRASDKCGTCSRDRLGIAPTDLSPEGAARMLQARLDGLNTIYSMDRVSNG